MGLPIRQRCLHLRAAAVLLLCVKIFTVAAQNPCVVAAMDTRLPLCNAIVRGLGGQNDTTNWQGHFNRDVFTNGATFVCKGYMTRSLTREELKRDSVFLLPLVTTLHGVEIFAPKADLKGAAALSTEELRNAARKASSGAAFDFFRIFDRRVRHVSEEERAKQKRILDNY